MGLLERASGASLVLALSSLFTVGITSLKDAATLGSPSSATVTTMR